MWLPQHHCFIERWRDLYTSIYLYLRVGGFSNYTNDLIRYMESLLPSVILLPRVLTSPHTLQVDFDVATVQQSRLAHTTRITKGIHPRPPSNNKCKIFLQVLMGLEVTFPQIDSVC